MAKIRATQCENIEVCPFCGLTGAQHIRKTDHAFGDKFTDQAGNPKSMYHVVCSGCAAFGGLKDSIDEAIEQWNFLSRDYYRNNKFCVDKSYQRGRL